AAARVAGPAAAPVPRAVAGWGAPGPAPAGPAPAARPVAAPRVAPRLPQPRPGRAGHHHRRPADTGPRHAAGAGRPGGAAVADPARRRTGARRGVAAAGRTRRHRCPARRPAGAMLAAADRTTLATAARSPRRRPRLPRPDAGRPPAGPRARRPPTAG